MQAESEKLLQLTGEIPFDNVNSGAIKNICANNLAICRTDINTNIFHGSHAHDSYEFNICYSDIPFCVIDSTQWERHSNCIFAVNPMQKHGLERDVNNFNLCGIHIDKKLLNEITQEIYNTSNVIFSNESYALNNEISMLLELLMEELTYKQSGYEFLTEHLEVLIISNFIRQIKHNLPDRPHNKSRSSNINLEIVLNYMNENYADDISCSEMAKLVNLGKYYFIRNFKSQIGKTPYEYLLDLKIEKAKKMLKKGELSITEISLMCGFSSHSHFTSTFKKKTGITPKEYQITLL